VPDKIKINDVALEEVISKWKTFEYSEEEQKMIIEARNKFKSIFTEEKIKNLKPEEYFLGKGKKENNLSYELEYGTLELGSIRGGSKLKYGYEKDFNKIKQLLMYILDFKDELKTFYNENGELSEKAKKICKDSQEITGLKTGRTIIGKLLSIYYPKTFIPIFTDQDYLLEKLIDNYTPKEIGSELFLNNNFLLIRIKESMVEKIPDSSDVELSNDKFMKFLYYCFPKEIKPLPPSEESFETLEYQHYQTLIHKNFSRLFKDELKYFDEESQNEHNGQYITEDAGTMDFLCLDKENNFMVIELKRRATDVTVGQLCRYMGWVKQTYCQDGREVRGLILADEKDKNLTYALNILSDVIEFRKIELSIKILKE